MIISGTAENGQILIPVKIKIDKFNVKGSAEFLLDTGATISFINESTALKIGLDFSQLLQYGTATGVGGEAETFQIDGYTRLTFETGDERKTIPRKNFLAMKRNFCEHVSEPSRRKILALQGVIGMDMLKGFRLQLAGENYSLVVWGSA
jgi:hypothetical protein